MYLTKNKNGLHEKTETSNKSICDGMSRLIKI